MRKELILGRKHNNWVTLLTMCCIMVEQTGIILQDGTCWVYIHKREVPDENKYAIMKIMTWIDEDDLSYI